MYSVQILSNTNMPACFLSTMHMNEAKDGELLTRDGSRKHNALINNTYTY